ncbi:MAG: hypothetical protein ACFB16_19375 [Phormidesmis sp.]
MTPPITFYIPPVLWPDALPTQPNKDWAGYRLGLYAWTVQTYLWLNAAGVGCQLASQLPEIGIVLCHSNALRSVDIEPLPQRLLVCIKAEAALSAIAPLHVVQNPLDISLLGNRYYVPHWPQPQLIARDASRGDRFETVAFFGHEDNLATELKSYAWQVALAERGLNGRVVANHNQWNQHSYLETGWNDYHDVDAIIAVRSFNPIRRLLTGGFAYKPATKLYNTWLAGAIPILGIESAYRGTGRRGEDYVEVKSFSDLLERLDQLKADSLWRRSLMAEGKVRSLEFTPEKIVRKWEVFLEAVAIPAYVEWCKYSARQRQQALLAAKVRSFLDRGKRKGRRLLLNLLPGA